MSSFESDDVLKSQLKADLSFYQLLGHLLIVAKKVAKERGLDESGYRLGNVMTVN